MQVTVYTHACYAANNFSDEGISTEIDLADFSSVPSSQDVHAYMDPDVLTRLGIDVNAEDNGEITIVEATDPQWEWFEGEDPTNWTIEQAWEFDDAVSSVDSSSIEQFGLFVTNYWNVRNQGTSGLLDAFHDAYQGTYASGEEYAQQLHEDLNDNPDLDLSKWPYSCIDWEAAWDELEVSGDNTGYDTQDGQMTIFNNHF